MEEILKTAALLALCTAAAVFAAGLKPKENPPSDSASDISSDNYANGEIIYKCLGNNDFRILCKETGEIAAMTENEYVARTVMAEMPADYPTEALKAQAAAVRTYAVRRRDEQLSAPSEELCGAYISDDPEKYLCPITDEQARKLYGDGFEEAYSKILTAAESVSDIIIISGGEPIAAVFHAVSAGRTENASDIWGIDVCYLKPVDSSFDSGSPEYLTKLDFTAAEVKGRLSAEYPEKNFGENISEEISVGKATPSGTVLSVICGGEEIDGEDFRRVFSLPSAVFELSPSPDSLSVTAYGQGNNIGMSRYGAKVLAENGYTYDEIIKYYYSGAETAQLVKIENPLTHP